MPKRSILAFALLLTVFSASCDGPTVLLPGGALEGTTVAIPDNWASLDEVETIQLETLPADPYSVNIWVIGLDENLYVHAGDNRSTWIENMETDPDVRLRAGDSIYELTASRVEGQDEFDRFSDAYELKYGRRPGNENVGEAYLFRLGPR